MEEKYDGIKALRESPYLLQIPSEASVEIGKILYETTGDEGYLDIIKKILMHLILVHMVIGNLVLMLRLV